MEDVYIPNFSKDDLAAAMGQLGLEPIDEVTTPIPDTQPQPLKRRRGRPRKHPLPDGSMGTYADGSAIRPEASTVEKIIEPAKLTKRDEREVADRLAKLLTGATGLASIPLQRTYVEMTVEEAKDIAEPLSSYLVRNADTIPIARQVLENYDLAAIVLGLIAYLVRVYGDYRVELATSQPEARRVGNAERPTLVRVSEIQEQANQRQQEQGALAETGTEAYSGIDPTNASFPGGYPGPIPGI